MALTSRCRCCCTKTFHDLPPYGGSSTSLSSPSAAPPAHPKRTTHLPLTDFQLSLAADGDGRSAASQLFCMCEIEWTDVPKMDALTRADACTRYDEQGRLFFDVAGTAVGQAGRGPEAHAVAGQEETGSAASSVRGRTRKVGEMEVPASDDAS